MTHAVSILFGIVTTHAFPKRESMSSEHTGDKASRV